MGLGRSFAFRYTFAIIQVFHLQVTTHGRLSWRSVGLPPDVTTTLDTGTTIPAVEHVVSFEAQLLLVGHQGLQGRQGHQDRQGLQGRQGLQWKTSTGNCMIQ